MKLAVPAVVAAASLVSSAAAVRGATLHEFGTGVERRVARDIVESACDMDVRLDGGLATVETRQRFANHGATAMAGAYELDLPEHARVIAASLRGEGTDDAAIAVSSAAGTDITTDTEILGADPALVQLVGAVDRGTRYRVVLEPIAPDHEVVLTTRWVMQAQVRNGALRLDLPGRAAAGQLVPCHATLKATAGPGATIGKLRAGTASAARDLAFVLGDDDLALDAELAFAKPEPLVWTQHADLGDGWNSALVTVVAPPVTSSSPIAHRALFVIDVSRSMQMIGEPVVARVVDAVAAALPAGTQIDAILYDRNAARVMGDWTAMDRAMPAIRSALEHHPALNGSDLPAALALAHGAIADGARDQTSVIVIGDGVLGQIADTALPDALAGKPSAVDVHAIVLAPGRGAGVKSPGAPELVRLVDMYGGTYVEVGVGDLDAALEGVDSWVRPSWVDLAVEGLPAGAIPSTLRAGAGASATLLVHAALPAFALVTHGDTPLKVHARDAGAAPSIGALVIANADVADAAAGDAAGDQTQPAPSKTDVARAEHARAALRTRFPAVDAARSFAVLASSGKVARNRRAMIAGGGPYTRTAEIADPVFPAPVAPVVASAAAPSAIDRATLERLFRDNLQPAAYACYQRALGPAPKLAGTVHFELHLSRGEVTAASVIGLGDAAFDACLTDAAYTLSPPLPDLAINSDDQTIAHYPLTFGVKADKPIVVAGDADSEQPLDIDAIQGGVPGTPARTIHVDSRTPLGGLRHP